MNGYDTEIFEMHTLPGGLCTAWNRKGYTFDGCIHWLVGSNPNDPFYDLWNELIDMKKLKFVDPDIYMRVEDKDGRFLRVFANVDALEKEMLEKAPGDKEIILTFTSAIRKLLKLQMPVDKARETLNLWDGIKLMTRFMPYIGLLRKYSRISIEDFASGCKSPLLKKTFERMFIPQMSVLFIMMTMVWMHRRSAGYPIGGSLPFARLIEKRYLELGGKIHYHSKIKKILTSDNSARGIQLENGETHEADIVISAADGYSTIYEMLEGKFLGKEIDYMYKNFKPFPSFLQVSLGVNAAFPGVSPLMYFELEKPLVVDPETRYDGIDVRVFNIDPTMAPEGKTVITSLIPTYNYQYWVELNEKNKEKYLAEKKRIADEFIEIADKKYGNIKSNVEVVDVSTPVSVIRYTNNWKGSFEGWILTPEVGLKQVKKEIPGLKNFYMIGQWVEPGGGLPACIISGRSIAQILCKKDKKKFTSLRFE